MSGSENNTVNNVRPGDAGISLVNLDADFLKHLAMELDDAAEGWEGGLADNVRAIVERLRSIQVVTEAQVAERPTDADRVAVAALIRPRFENWAKDEWFFAGADTTYYEICSEYNDRELQAAWEGYHVGVRHGAKPHTFPKLTHIATVVSKFGDPEAFGERKVQIDPEVIKGLPYGAKLYVVEGS